MVSQQLHKVLNLEDSRNVEVVSSMTDDLIIARAIAALANSGGGHLVVGVQESGIVGLRKQEADDTISRIQKIGDSLLPTGIVAEKRNLGGLIIVVATIGAVPTELGPVRTADGAIYRRNDNSIYMEPPQALPNIEPSKGSPPTIAFVAMSFHFEEEPALVDYYEAIRRAVANTKFPIAVIRIDLLEGDYEIMSKTEEQIATSDIVIADFTLNSPNVYYEAGIARASQKYLIRCARRGTVLPFDLRQYRTLFYTNATQLEAAMTSAIAEGYDHVTRSKN